MIKDVSNNIEKLNSGLRNLANRNAEQLRF